jgi:general secretion pathway protein C
MDDYSDWLRRAASARWFANLALLIAITVAAWVLSQVFWRFAFPPEPAPVTVFAMDSKSALGQAVARHWFGVPASGPAVVGTTTIADVKLRGVVAQSASRKGGMAIFSVQGGPDRVFAVGEEISPGVSLIGVQGKSATIRRSGREEQVALPQRGRS